MATRRYLNTGIPARELAKLPNYLNAKNSASLGQPWRHEIWWYKLSYPDGVLDCKDMRHVRHAIRDRGETSSYVAYFKSHTGRKLRFDTTNPSEIVVEVENKDKTLPMLDYLEEMMGLSSYVKRVFITHGKGLIWREIQSFIERECTPTLETIELASRASKGRTIIEKLEQEAQHCSYAVVLMTADDLTVDGEERARENVIHEIGFFQGRYGRSRVCLLHEDGVNIPSNLSGVVYAGFPKDRIEAVLIELQRELQAAFSDT